eukprot:3844314-Prorocentrum_lima.AAC.1
MNDPRLLKDGRNELNKGVGNLAALQNAREASKPALQSLALLQSQPLLVCKTLICVGLERLTCEQWGKNGIKGRLNILSLIHI